MTGLLPMQFGEDIVSDDYEHTEAVIAGDVLDVGGDD